jgi:hypothetical protein
VAREDGRDTGGHWGGVDGARRWLGSGRRRQGELCASAAEEWGQ